MLRTALIASSSCSKRLTNGATSQSSRLLIRGRASLSTSAISVSSSEERQAEDALPPPPPPLHPRPQETKALRSLVSNLLAKQTFVSSGVGPGWNQTTSYVETSATVGATLSPQACCILGGATTPPEVRGTSTGLTSVTTKSYSATVAVAEENQDPLFTPYEEEEIDFDDESIAVGGDTNRPINVTPAASETSAAPQETVDEDTMDSSPPAPPAMISRDRESGNTSQPYHPLVTTLTVSINGNNTSQALRVFYDLQRLIRQAKQCHQEPPIPPAGIIKKLFRMCCPRHPLDAYHVLQYFMTFQHTGEYYARDGDINGYSALYNRLCDSLRYLDPDKHSLADIEVVVRSVSAAVKRMERAGQELCCPVLVSALLEQRSVHMGYEFAEPIYSYIMREQFAVPDGWFIHLLSYSKYNRQYDLPFDDVLEQSMTRGRHPPPAIVLHALDNFFPFTNVETVARYLKSVIQLQQSVVENAKKAGRPVHPTEQYWVDIGTLEMIGAGAASQGSSDINLLIWDMLDLLGYEPTVGIYENTVVAFAMNTFTYKEAFTVLAEMEAAGFEPSRAVIRSCSRHVR